MCPGAQHPAPDRRPGSGPARGLSAPLPPQTLPPGGSPARTMNEAKESLRGIEQKYKLFQQQQFTFVAALEHCRENAHDKIRPISSIEQVGPGEGGGRPASRAPARPRFLGGSRPWPLLGR